MFDVSKAACQGMSTDIFFSNEPEDIKEAKNTCIQCEVRLQCLQWAISQNEAGIWGGFTEGERKRMPRRKKAVLLNISPK